VEKPNTERMIVSSRIATCTDRSGVVDSVCWTAVLNAWYCRKSCSSFDIGEHRNSEIPINTGGNGDRVGGFWRSV